MDHHLRSSAPQDILLRLALDVWAQTWKYRITNSVVCEPPNLCICAKGCRTLQGSPHPFPKPFSRCFPSSANLCSLSHVGAPSHMLVLPGGLSCLRGSLVTMWPLPPLSPFCLDRPVIFSLSSSPQTHICPLLSCFQLNHVLSGIPGHTVLWSPERKMTALGGEGIPTEQPRGLGQRYSGGGLKAVETLRADGVGGRRLWRVHFPSLPCAFLSQLQFLRALTFQS